MRKLLHLAFTIVLGFPVAIAPSSLLHPAAARAPRPYFNCAAFAAESNVVLAWDRALLTVISQTPTAPTVASRSLAVLHTAIYDAWAAYDEHALATTTFGLHRRPPAERTEANKREAISYAAYVAAANLYSDLKSVCFQPLMNALGYSVAVDADNADVLPSDPTTPGGLGVWAGRQVIAVHRSDGSNENCEKFFGTCVYPDKSGYVPVNAPAPVTGTATLVDPNRWQPLIVRDPDYAGDCALAGAAVFTQTFTTPHWGNVQPFAFSDAAAVTTTLGQILWPDPGYELQAREMISISGELDDEKKVIAEYWSNGPDTVLPPGHWALFGQYVSARDAHSLDDDARMFFTLTNAVFDAGIMAWGAKRAHDSVRPITAVHFALAGQTARAWAGSGQGVRDIPAEEWLPYQKPCFVTPPFGEYVSGHSAFSAAGAEVLRNFTGSDAFGESVVIAAGSSVIEPGITPSQPVTLTWATFSEAADQSGLSRRYSGIHFERGDLDGRALGRVAGEHAWARAQQYISGTLPTYAVLVPFLER